MTSILHQQAATYKKPRPEVRPGYTVRIHERIQEGNKERIQIFEGLVISVHKGLTPTDSTFTVRRIASGVGVEKVFPLHSPKIEKIEVKKVAKVRRAKLFFLRGRRGKAARLSERFTTAEEFAVGLELDVYFQPDDGFPIALLVFDELAHAAFSSGDRHKKPKNLGDIGNLLFTEPKVQIKRIGHHPHGNITELIYGYEQ